LFIFPKLLDGLNLKLAPLLNKLQSSKNRTPSNETKRSNRSRLFGEFSNGILLGPVWAPCSGPTLGIVMGLLASQESNSEALFLLIFFAIGALIPLLILSYGAQRLVQNIKSIGLAKSNLIKTSVGVLSFTMAVLILTGTDKYLEAYLVSKMPESWVNLTVAF
jgi:cytochrome c-type biogenesis protein